MAATGTPTPNLGLRIPVGTDPASVDDINYNSNLLDTALGAVGNTSVKDQLDELSDQIATINNKLPITATNTYRTDAGGSVLVSPAKLFILSAICQQGYICLPFYYTNGTTYIKILDVATLQAVPSQDVTIEMRYLAN